MSFWSNLVNRFRPARDTAATTTATTATTPAAPAASGPLAPAFDRNNTKFPRQIKRALSEAADLGEGFYAARMHVACANVQGTPHFYGYKTNKPQTLSLSKPPPDNRLDLTLAMNVSAHDFKNLADKESRKLDRATKNAYVIQVTHPDGKVDTLGGIKANGAFSSAQDISIRDLKPGVTVVEMWPEGSAGVHGYVEGRRLEISLNAGNVDRFG